MTQGENTRAQAVRYLLAGAWNTAFGYAAGVLLYLELQDRWHIVAIALAANVAGITMSFLTYKLFVFRTRGNWLAEYLRSYAVYGVTAAIGTFAFWLIVGQFRVPVWLGQAAVIAIAASISYVMHRSFTFKTPSA